MEIDHVVRLLLHDRAKLLGYIWAIVRDHHLANDVFQEVTVLAIQKANEINDSAHLLVWSRRAGRFKALEALRNRTYRAVSLDEDVVEMLESDWATMDRLAMDDEIVRLRACIERLTPRAQKVLQLRYSEGFSGARVAEIVRVKVHSVYVMLSRIHKALEDCVRKGRLSHEGA